MEISTIIPLIAPQPGSDSLSTYMLPGSDWLIGAKKLPEPTPERLQECVYHLTNGYFGCRAALPFGPKGTRGTYINGLYAHGPADLYWVPEADQLWDKELFPTHESIRAHGREWALVASPNLFYTFSSEVQTKAFTRTLDMQSALLHIEGDILLDGNPWHFHAMRFASKDQTSCVFERITLTPCNHSQTCEINIGIDDDIKNVRASGKTFDLWASKKFLNTSENSVIWQGITLKKNMKLGISMSCTLTKGTGTVIKGTSSDCFCIKGNGELVIDRFVALSHTRLELKPYETSQKIGQEISYRTFDAHLQSHRARWKAIWNRADIIIDGPLNDQQSLRYSTYQIMCAMLDTSKIAIGLNALSDEGYHGLIFWDMDIYILPLITRTFPEKAKNHLLFRHAGIPAAKEKALRNGYKGTMFPWESAPTGEEGISPWILLNRTQVHIVGAVAWGVVDYFKWTHDTEFMETKGWELLAETARFWSSKTNAKGEILFVAGPDEFNQNVDNNAYTNHLARLNLLWSIEYCAGKVDALELAQWKEVADRIKQKQPNELGIIEQFDGFYEHPEKQIGKQADVIAMVLANPDSLTGKMLESNYHYYIERCKHLSSLSEPAYALCASHIGLTDEAYRLYQIAADIDLRDLHTCCEFTGHHIACSALVSRVILEGFCKMRLIDNSLSFAATLPKAWKSVAFTLNIRGKERKIKLIDGEKLALRLKHLAP